MVRQVQRMDKIVVKILTLTLTSVHFEFYRKDNWEIIKDIIMKIY